MSSDMNLQETEGLSNTSRHLASIQKIDNLAGIVGADKIETASILGWKAVVQKGQYKVGDPVIYCEVDSVLPEKPEFEFMRVRHFRVRTIKLRGQISQGLVFPLTILPSPIKEQMLQASPDKLVGKDVTELLGIKKYEPDIPAQLRGIVKGSFPSFLRKTEEIRIQSVPKVLLRHQGVKGYWSEKVDGTSGTFFYYKGTVDRFGVCSRNLELTETESNTYWKVARELKLEEKLKQLDRSLAIQGEILGPGIQKNKYGLDKVTLLVFSVFDISGQKYVDFAEMKDIVDKLQVTLVPIIGHETLEGIVSDLVTRSEGMSLLNPSVPREGMVFRPEIETFDEDLGRLSFKVINPRFLLKYDE